MKPMNHEAPVIDINRLSNELVSLRIFEHDVHRRAAGKVDIQQALTPHVGASQPNRNQDQRGNCGRLPHRRGRLPGPA